MEQTDMGITKNYRNHMLTGHVMYGLT